jgi:hypothetical protein
MPKSKRYRCQVRSAGLSVNIHGGVKKAVLSSSASTCRISVDANALPYAEPADVVKIFWISAARKALPSGDGHEPRDGERILVFDGVNDDVFAHGETAVTSPEIFPPGTSNIWESRQSQKAFRHRVNQAIGNLDAAAFARKVNPDVVEIGFSMWRYAMRHLFWL